MKAMKGKRAKKAATPVRSKGPADLAKVRQEIVNLVGNQAVSLVQATIDEGNKGHYAATKYLFEMVGLYPGTAEPDEPVDDSLARALLRRIGVPEEDKGEGTGVASD